MDLAKWTGKAKEIPGKFMGALAAVPKAMVNAFDALTGIPHRNRRTVEIPPGKDDKGENRRLVSGKIDAFTARFLHRFPEDKRKLVFFGIGGLAVLFFILIIAILIGNSGKPGKPASQATIAGPVIPQEDLFMPAEPDFLPEFLLERDPRLSWSMEDIRPYWKSPEKTGRWQEEIKSAVDELMEGVQ